METKKVVIQHRACKKSVLIALMLPILAGSGYLNFMLIRGDLVSKSCAGSLLASSADNDYLQTLASFDKPKPVSLHH